MIRDQCYTEPCKVTTHVIYIKPLLTAAVIVVSLCCSSAIALTSWSEDLTATYVWNPVRIGGGGCVTGMALDPQNPTIRYIRTNVGNAYRWNTSTGEWTPMRIWISNEGVSGDDSSSPSAGGEESIAVDPTNASIVYMVYAIQHSADIEPPTNVLTLYRSTDGGTTFTSLPMSSAQILDNPNDTHDNLGERLAIDPSNTSVIYFASESQGLFRTVDGGTTWVNISGIGAPPSNIEFTNVLFSPIGGTTTVSGMQVSRVLFAISIRNANDAGGDVYLSTDGGITWSDISVGIRDQVTGDILAGQAYGATIDPSGTVYVPENAEGNMNNRAFWRYANGQWARISLGNAIDAPVASVIVDPTDTERVYVLGTDTSLSRSDDAGKTWNNLGGPAFSNTLGWLPQTIGVGPGADRCNGGLKIDTTGNLWVPGGAEGVLMMSVSTASSATSNHPPNWTIVSQGIEELVTMDAIIPPGSNDTLIVATLDSTGFVIHDLDAFDAVQIPLQMTMNSDGVSVDYSPDVPSYIAISSSWISAGGPSYSGFSTDGGSTWHAFKGASQYPCGDQVCNVPAGQIAVGMRGNRTLGQDHLVLYPANNFAPEYSQDGGQTWHVTQSFPLAADGMTLDTSTGQYLGFTPFWAHQHLLRADPFVDDKFYLILEEAPYSIYTSEDGGQTWEGQPGAGLPGSPTNGQLIANHFVKGDLWFADGFQDASAHGLFHSTDGGHHFSKVSGVTWAFTLAIGAGSGRPGDDPYSVYFYGLLSDDTGWGIFRSTDGGITWNRIAYYPDGIYDRPATLAASQDTFGLVVVGLNGNSFLYGEPLQLPSAPNSLTAEVATSGQVSLSWTAPPGGNISYDIYRGTSAGSLTRIQSGLHSTDFEDGNVAPWTTYLYAVSAVNQMGEGPQSATVEVTVPGAMAAPSDVTATQVANSVAIALTWQPPAIQDGITGYIVVRSSGVEANSSSTEVNGTQYVDSDVVSGMTYSYSIGAIYASGIGPMSNEVSVSPEAPVLMLSPAQGVTFPLSLSTEMGNNVELVLTAQNYVGQLQYTCSGMPVGYFCSVVGPTSISSSNGIQVVPISVQLGCTSVADANMAYPYLVIGILMVSRKRQRRVLLVVLTLAVCCFGAQGCGAYYASQSSRVTVKINVEGVSTNISGGTALTVQLDK